MQDGRFEVRRCEGAERGGGVWDCGDALETGEQEGGCGVLGFSGSGQRACGDEDVGEGLAVKFSMLFRLL